MAAADAAMPDGLADGKPEEAAGTLKEQEKKMMTNSPDMMAAASQVHTPPETDETSHSHKDDDAASSSSLSDLGDEIDLPGDVLGDLIDGEEDTKFEDAARAGAEAEQFSEVKPDRYEGGIPIFQPVYCQFFPMLCAGVSGLCGR
jgi:hypothetical protein